MYGFGLKCDRFNKQNIGRLKMPNEMSPKSLPEMTVKLRLIQQPPHKSELGFSIQETRLTLF